MSINTNQGCCEPQKLTINSNGYLSITDGNSVFLGDIINSLGIKTPVIDFSLNGFLLSLTYTNDNGQIVTKTVDLTSLVTGPGLTVANTNSLNLDLTAAILSGNVNISAVANNSIVINSDGLWAPASTQIPINTTDSSTLSLVASGSFNTDLTGSVKVSADLSNQLTIVGDGLFVADMTTYISPGTNITIVGSGTAISPYVISAGGFTNIPLSVIDTATIDLTTSGAAAHTLQADVKVSTATGNAILINSDGLFVPLVNFVPFTTQDARNSISVTAPLFYNSTTGVIGIFQSGVASNGYLSSVDWNIFNSKVTSAVSLGPSGSIPIYASETGTVLGFNALSAGANISLTQVGNNIIIAATGGSSGPGAPVFTLDFIVGDGGTFTPLDGAVTFSPSVLLNKTILGVWVEGVKIAGVTRTGGALFYSFTSNTATFTLSQPFATDTYYSIMYR